MGKEEIKKIEVEYCTGCPFSNVSTSGHKAIGKVGGRLRVMRSCKLQPEIGNQWSKERKYKCFETCPLRENAVHVSIKNI